LHVLRAGKRYRRAQLITGGEIRTMGPDQQVPGEFEFYLGSTRDAAFGAWWDGKGMIYESFDSGYRQREQIRLTPSSAQWHRFWRTVDQLGVWQWARRYEPGTRFEPNTVIRDGTHWSLTLARGRSRVESSGDSSGPNAVDLDDSAVFTRFLEAVSRLLGGREFA
jgi:hypothetical protein